MPDLIAVGPQPKQRWRRKIPEGQVIRLGRAPREGWSVPWDQRISREHAELLLVGPDQMQVRHLEVGRNPVSYRGTASREFILSVGEEFQIGHTWFRLADAEVRETVSEPVEERYFQTGELKRFSFRNAAQQLDVLSKLPGIIANAADDDEKLAFALVGLLLEAIPHAGAVAVLRYPSDIEQVDPSQPLTFRWDCRDESWVSGLGAQGRFRPSRRLIMQALESGQTLLHIWGESAHTKTDPVYTCTGKFDWAYCTPFNDISCQGWCIYVSGRLTFRTGPSLKAVTEDELRGDLRFTELLADFVGATRRIKMLEKQQAGLSRFFSPAVVEMLRCSNAAETLAPRETEIASLFCDVRGFSRKTEQARDDLPGLLRRLSDVLGVMTCGILKYDGVIADFQGDAALGFWGWPMPAEDGPLSACRAALEIYQQFTRLNERAPNQDAKFSVGIGIAHGRAIAGKMGTDEQIKVGVFGPVVNLSSRLESLTKQLQVPILLDEATADAVRQSLPADVGRCRRLARVRPYGMKTPVTVSELLPPADFPGTITDQQIRDYEDVVNAVIEGRWNAAREMLDSFPVKDRAKDFLIASMAHSHYEPPVNWDGVFDLSMK